MHYPVSDKETLRVNGDTEQLGSWKEGKGPIDMMQTDKEVEWLTGEKVRPW